MEEVTLESKERAAHGTRAARQLRKKGLTPLTLNSKGEKSQHLQSAARDVEIMLRKGARIVVLTHPGGKDKVFVKQVQFDHVGEKIYHVDFTKIAKDTALELEVDLILKGKPAGVVEEGGVLDQYLKTVRVSCLPDAIPDKIEADVTHLKMKGHLTIADLKVPAGVKLIQEPTLVLAAVNEHVLEEATAAPAEPGPLEPEVIKKERAVDEEGAEEGAKKEKAPADKKEEKK